MRPREFAMCVVGAAFLRPRASHAQQVTLPVLGFLDSSSPVALAPFTAEFRRGLGEVGFVEGRNVRIEYRWAH